MAKRAMWTSGEPKAFWVGRGGMQVSFPLTEAGEDFRWNKQVVTTALPYPLWKEATGVELEPGQRFQVLVRVKQIRQGPWTLWSPPDESPRNRLVIVERASDNEPVDAFCAKWFMRLFGWTPPPEIDTGVRVRFVAKVLQRGRP